MGSYLTLMVSVDDLLGYFQHSVLENTLNHTNDVAATCFSGEVEREEG